MKIKYSLVIILTLVIFITPFSLMLFSEKLPNTSKTASKDTFKVLDIGDNTVKTLDEKEYLYGALLSELTANRNIEAIKAQVVATYTYAIKMKDSQTKQSDPNLNGAYFKVDTKNKIGYITEKIAKQKFKGEFKEIKKKILQAIDEVYRTIVVFGGEPIVASYHTINSGMTESSENVWGNAVPYLVAVESVGDTKAEGYMVEKRMSSDEVKKILTSTFSDIVLPDDKMQWLNITKQSQSKGVITINVGNKTISGREARSIFSLRSIAFTVQPINDDFIFTTYGLGYGVGLSQVGADHLANEGKNYVDILKHYYVGTETKVI